MATKKIDLNGRPEYPVTAADQDARLAEKNAALAAKLDEMTDAQAKVLAQYVNSTTEAKAKPAK